MKRGLKQEFWQSMLQKIRSDHFWLLICVWKTLYNFYCVHYGVFNILIYGDVKLVSSVE